MNARERLAMALSHQEPDRVPVDLGGSSVTAISDFSLKKVMDRYHIDEPAIPFDPIQGISILPDELRDLLGIDTVRVGPSRIPQRFIPDELNGRTIEELADLDFLLQDQWGALWRHKPGERYCSQSVRPLQHESLGEALLAYRMPEPEGESLRRELPPLVGMVGERFPLFDRDCAGLFEMSQRLRGMERLFMDLYDDIGAVERLADTLLDYKKEYWKTFIAIIEKCLTSDTLPLVITEADDYGTGTSLLIAPKILRRIYLKRLKELVSYVKELDPRVRICFHSCGAIRELIPDLIEIGIDILNPVQYTAAGMDLAGLKRDFGKDLVFWGGCIDTSKILPFGTPGEVSDEVKRVIDIMAPGGGFVAAAVHNIQADVPLENLVSLFETLSDYGRYRS